MLTNIAIQWILIHIKHAINNQNTITSGNKTFIRMNIKTQILKLCIGSMIKNVSSFESITIAIS